MIPTITITPSIEIPLIGMGTWELRGKECEAAVSNALEIGYRHIDTALLYENHASIRRAVSSFPRKELFITSKFLTEHLKHHTVSDTCDRSLEELGTDYLDLYLLHYPDRNVSMKEILAEMEQLVEDQKVRAIGASNCTIGHLKDMLEWSRRLTVNQVEFHPYLYQKGLWDFCKVRGIQITSYRPLGKGVLVHDPVFETIGRPYGKSSVQVALRWLIEKKIPTIPKATSVQHLKENFSIFDFSLSAQDMAILDAMKTQHRFCDNGSADFNYS